MKNTEEKKELSIQNQNILQILGMLLLFIGMVVISNKLTDMGNGYWGIGSAIFLLFYYLFPLSLQHICGKIQKNRISKEQYQNVLNGVSFFLLFAIVFGVIGGLFLWFIAPEMASLFQSKLSAMVIQVYAIVFFLSCILAILRGNIHVTKSNPYVHLSYYIEATVAFIAMLLLSKWWVGYGKKTSVLLQNDQIQYGYNGCVVPIGFCFGMIVAIIFLSVFLVANISFWKIKTKNDTNRYRENKKSLLRRIILSFPEEWGKQHLLSPLLFSFFAILISQKRLVTEELPFTSIYNFGSFAGKLCIIEIITFYALKIWLNQWKDTVKPVLIQGEKKFIRAYLVDGVKIVFLAGFGVSLVLEILSPWIVRLLFLGDQSITLKIFRFGSFSILFFMLYMYFSQVLLFLKRKKINQIIDVLGFIVGVLFHLCFATKGISILGISITVYFMITSLIKWYYTWKVLNIPLAIDISFFTKVTTKFKPNK